MKALKIIQTHTHTRGNTIDNDWTKFLMGCNSNDDCCGESSLLSTFDKNNHNQNKTYNNNRGKTTKDKCNKKKLINKINPYQVNFGSSDNDIDHDDDDDNHDPDNIYSDNLNTNTNMNMNMNMNIQNENNNKINTHYQENINEERKIKNMARRTCTDADADTDADTDAERESIEVPSCSPIYISTKTKISFLNTPIDIKKVFWDIPIMPYASQRPGIIKKQIKFSCTTKEELQEIEEHTQKEIENNDGFIETQIIEHIDNPEGRIKFKDHRKINIGLSKKDILNCRSKKKRAFFNCFVLIVRVEDENSPTDARIFKEMHIKVFNTGKLEIPGIQHEDSLQNVIDILIRTLKSVIGEHVECQKDKCETVLINSNFNCGFYIDRDKLYNILKYKYRINSNYDSCSYPGIQCKFFYYTGTDNTISNLGQQPTTNLNDYIEISFMIFRTGSVLIVGKCEDYVLHDIYAFIKKLFQMEFLNIYSHVIQPEDEVVRKHVPKIRSRKIINNV